ncbi:glycosyltransferase family 4 protein [Spirosoma taeanense]|uniref:Glycosyltransferase family 4 protein n=1 Tax=Spirosoma taeanense TaxID=2735870 RepID=A0A6M5Y4X3_9BACT|nr:glycosyltransferase family 1 protein [Spirosoma taeanense]QJW88153.1 glycosyltransferase family 4 protein [Spirosoma taeanense]
MKIGIEGQRLFRREKHGMDIYVLEVIKAIQQLDKTNEYVVFVKDDEDRNCLSETDNVKIVTVPGGNYALWEQVNLPRAAKQHGVDLLHCTSNTAPLFASTPTVVTIHDLIYMEKTAGDKTATMYQRVGNEYRRWIVPQVAKRCRRVLADSEYTRQDILKLFHLPETQVRVSYLGVSPKLAQSLKIERLPAIRQRYNLPERYFFYLGSQDPRKNMRTVLNAFGKFAQTTQGVDLVVSGKPPIFWNELLQQSGNEQLADRCRFIGFVEAEDLSGLYAQAEVYLYPSLSEGFGLPILEAMSCGVPVITSTTTSMPEVGGDVAVLVDPYKPDEITQAMMTLYNDPALRQQKVAQGLRRVEQFSWQRTAREVLATYQEVYASLS